LGRSVEGVIISKLRREEKRREEGEREGRYICRLETVGSVGGSAQARDIRAVIQSVIRLRRSKGKHIVLRGKRRSRRGQGEGGVIQLRGKEDGVWQVNSEAQILHV